ncbi:hypothetical protein [Litorisediminicola beolgyonensis]|uniref:Uncharacterized protein n=1 Tax=Litorisediminicola beolgyonensis TaxID=1173614 RepID=A0ABW3ZJI7_9RHOB
MTIPQYKIDRIIELARENVSRLDIATQVGVPAERVYSIIAEQRKKGVPIARPTKMTGNFCTKPRIVIEQRVLDTLEPFALHRNMTARELAAEILELVARDGIVDAVLDDGGARD